MPSRLPDDRPHAANGQKPRPDLAEILGKLPISDIKAEQGLIGSLVYDPRLIDEISLPPESFYLETHGKIFALIRKKREAGDVIDFLTLSTDLIPLGGGDGTDWEKILADAVEIAQHPGNCKWYAKTVKERWTRRTAVYAAQDVMRELYDTPDVDAILGRHMDMMVRLTESSETEDATECGAGLLKVLSLWESPLAQGHSTGYPDIDAKIGGLQGQRLYLIAAKTAIGKSALVINIGAHVARTTPVLFISLEMPESEVYSRLASSVLRRSTESMRSTVYTEQSTSEFTDQFNDIGRLHFRVDDRGGRTVSSIGAQARKHHRKNGLGLLIVDYLQLVSPADSRIARHEQVGQISRGLKLIAKSLNIPVIALSQLSRQADVTNTRPQLYHLKDSGSLEQDSDVVMLIDRERDKDETVLHIEKNRSGQTGPVQLLWRPECVRYDSKAWQSAEVYDPVGDWNQ